MKKKILIFSIVFLAVDQISKIILDKILILGKSISIFEKFLYITKAYNDGISFSMLTGHRWLIILISIFVMVFLYFYMRCFKENKRNIIAFSLVYGGLFGNLIDRIVHGYVIDFIDFYVLNYNYPIFNLADSFICIGILMILYAIFLGEDNENSRK
ncbi:MAG: signal peptidase II [Bacilli bacterium]|nr:signal peptidase II [Bacilli bacterium]